MMTKSAIGKMLNGLKSDVDTYDNCHIKIQYLLNSEDYAEAIKKEVVPLWGGHFEL